MNSSKIAWSLGIMAILLTSTVATVLPVEVKAQNATIVSSSDRFFGPALVEITVTAPDDNADSNRFDTSEVEIEVEDDDGNTVATNTFTLNETGKNTGRFELFIAAHTTADPHNPSTGATTVRIYAGSNDINQKLGEGYKIIVKHLNSGVEKEITYEPTTATFNTDRTTAGKNNIITLIVNDQDANLDPTGVDEFTASTTIINATGATLNLDSTKFKETGSNTGVFELDVEVEGANARLTDITTYPTSVSFTLTDHDVYHQTNDTYPNGDNVVKAGSPPFNVPDATTSTISKSVELRNFDGQIRLTKDLTIGNGFAIEINDPDRNNRTDVEDTLSVTGIIGQLNVTFKETGDNTGVFLPDLSNNRIPIVVVPDNRVPNNIKVDDTNDRILVDASDIAAEPDITITYNDPVGDNQNGEPETISITTEIEHEAGTISTETPTVPINGKAVIIIDDMDLDTDSTIVNSHTAFNAGGDDGEDNHFANHLANLKMSISAKTITDVPSMVFTEIDGVNSGRFRAEFDVDDITLDGDTLEDGDTIKVEYKDNTESPSITRSVNIRVSVASASIELDRNSYPPSKQTAAHSDNDNANPEKDNDVILRVTITDPAKNKSPTSRDSITLNSSNFKLELLDSTDYTINPGQNTIGTDQIKGADGNLLKPISDTTADETGVDTGKFEVEIKLPAMVGNNIIDDDYQIRVTYKTASDDEVSDTASIRSTTATISTDSLTYNLGQSITLIINEPDWNTDSKEKDIVDADISAIFVDARKDGTLNDVVTASDGNMELDPDQIEETEPNSGIFKITIKNINGEFVERGSTIKFEFEDNTTTGGAGAETIRHTVTITSGIPEIIFDKEVYTPFEEACVTIVDPSANVDPESRDTLPQVKVEVGEFEDTFTSSISNKFEETDVNSGVFMLNQDECIQLDASQWDNGNSNTNDGTLPAARDKAIRVTYETETDDIELTKSALIVFNDGSIAFDKSSYKVGDSAVITVIDADLNQDPDVEDTVDIDVWSTSDRAGIDLTLRETGDRTGVFRGEVLLSSDLSSGSRLHVADGDTITARYVDRTLPDPADYDEDRDATTSIDTQRLDATATIGISKLPTERVPASMPEVVDELGNEIDMVMVGQQVLISSEIKNNQTISQNFVHIVKVMDADGNVVVLAFTQGKLNPNETRTNAFSWTPEEAGTYTVEIFVWESFANPVALSPKIVHEIEVM